jgi:hypothetical protein
MRCTGKRSLMPLMETVARGGGRKTNDSMA